MEYKRRKGKKVGEKAGSGIRAAIVIIISVALLAGILVFSPVGDYLLNNVLIPLFSHTPEKAEDEQIISALMQQDEQKEIATPAPTAKPTETARQTLTINETKFYILQMGSFLEKSSAERHAQEIRRMGAGGTILTDGAIFRVFAAAYTDQESLEKVQGQVRSDGFEATPYITEKKAIRITLNGDPGAVHTIENAIGLISSVPEEMCVISLSYDKRTLNDKDLLGKLQKTYANCKDCGEALAEIKDQTVDPIRQLLEKYTEKLSTFLDEHDTIDPETVSGDLKNLQLSIIVDYILFFDQK